MTKMDDLLNQIEENCDQTSLEPQLRLFRVQCLMLIAAKMPPVARESFELLLRSEGTIDQNDLMAALERLWGCLDSKARRHGLSQAEISAVRAVILAVDAEKRQSSDDLVDSISFFLTLINTVEPHYEEEEILIRRHFAGCLGA